MEANRKVKSGGKGGIFVVLVVLVLCSGAFGQPWPGSGVEGDPYQIWTAEDMQAIGADANYWGAHFRLMADIDLSAYTGTSYNIIGNFQGVFDGNGHTISNLTYTSTGTESVGLFGRASGRIKDLGLINPNVDAGNAIRVGGLAGRIMNPTISNCYVEGGSVYGNDNVGGLVGDIWSCTISNCYATASVSGTTNVGGLVGKIESGGKIRNCYSEGSVSGDDNVGGLVGRNNQMEVTNCYSTGAVSGTTKVGGLVGSGGTVCSSFWDIQTSGQSTSGGGTGKTTAEMQTASTFLGWGGCGNEGVWVLDEESDYPRLWWENKPGQPLLPESLSDFLAGSGTEQDPYLIETGEQMNLVGVFWCEWGKHFKLTADIDLSAYTGTSFNIIGTGWFDPYVFYGTFDGNGHTISNFSYDSNNTDNIGLFGFGGGIRDLGLINPIVDAGSGNCVGSLVAQLYFGTITNCYVEGGSVSGNDYVGGLVGENISGSITNCSSNTSVLGHWYIGGLVASGERINTCYSSGTVSGDKYIGGLVGDSGGTFNSYSKASVTGIFYLGGLVGTLSRGGISNCYSAGSVSGVGLVGGLLGYNEAGTITDSFWDTDTSGQEGSDGGVGLSTELMQSALVFTAAGWDFVGEVINGTEDIWEICEGMNYPKFVWQIPEADFVCPDGVNFIDYSFFAGHWGETDYGDVDGVELTRDGRVNWEDFGVFAGWWMVSGCGDCGGADLTGEGDIDYADLDVFTGYWLESEYGDCGGAELTGDGQVGADDLREFSDNWLEGL